MTDASGAVDRFSGFADLYDSVRPTPPDAIGPLLCRYANEPSPLVIDLGSGTGLSSRWAATWARSVIGVEPSDDMRAVATTRPVGSVAYRSGFSFATGLPGASADVVIILRTWCIRRIHDGPRHHVYLESPRGREAIVLVHGYAAGSSGLRTHS
jgi:SAM-dependent methyltransferase